MTPSLPSKIPPPSVTFSEESADAAVRTTMESGIIRQRRGTTTDLMAANVEWELDSDEDVLFRAWLTKTVRLVDWFMLNLLIDGDMRPCKVRLRNGKFSRAHIAHAHWKITATLDIEKPVNPAEQVLDLLLDDTFMAQQGDFISSVSDLSTFTHTTLKLKLQ